MEYSWHSTNACSVFIIYGANLIIILILWRRYPNTQILAEEIEIQKA